MSSSICHSCGEELPLDHACKMRIEEDGNISSYHIYCPEPKICPDCGYHRNVCEECCE